MAKQRFRVRTIYTTHIDKVVEADDADEAEQIAFCITGDEDAYRNNLDNSQTEVEEVSEREELTEITADDEQWIARYRQHQAEQVARGGA